MKRICIRFLVTLLFIGIVALPAFSYATSARFSNDENLTLYQARYAAQVEKLRDIAVRTSSSRVYQYAQKLIQMGFFSGSYSKSNSTLGPELGRAVSLYKQQSGIGENGDITALTQVLLDNEPPIQAVFPTVYLGDYSLSRDGYSWDGRFVYYGLNDLKRIKLKDARELNCAVRGTIAVLDKKDGQLTLTVQVDGNQEFFTVQYQPPANSSEFLVGDVICIFGEVRENENQVVIKAHLVGFHKEYTP